MIPTNCFLALILLIGISMALPQKSKLDTVIEDIFKQDCDKNSNQPCVLVQPQPATEAQPYKSCGKQGLCVPRFLCKQEIIVTTGEGVFEERVDARECEGLEVCCDMPNKETDQTATIKPKIETKSNITTNAFRTPDPTVQRDGCGYRNPQGIGLFRITGNTDTEHEAEFGEFPWMVAILNEMPDAKESISSRFVCGGALIAPTVITTAAHCIRHFKANTLIARAGEWDTNSKTELIPDQNRQVREIILHENFNKGSLYNDIALLIVDSPFEYMENVRPICLPPPNTNFDHARCYVTGWGKDKFGKEGIYPVVLKKIDLPIVPNGQCQTNLRATRLGKLYNLHESFTCAGGEAGKDACTGDGGSPLVCPIEGKNEQYYQAGIVAYGVGCGEENVPGVYANVAQLRPWINEKMTQLKIDFTHFTA